MQLAGRLLIFLALSASLCTALLPVASAVPRFEKSSCCAKMKMDGQRSDCGRQMPKSKQDQQCCAACAIGLALFLNSATTLVAPPFVDESFAIYTFDQCVRSDRPPVPPPRLLAV